MSIFQIKLWSAEGENGLDFLIENSLFSVYQGLVFFLSKTPKQYGLNVVAVFFTFCVSVRILITRLLLTSILNKLCAFKINYIYFCTKR